MPLLVGTSGNYQPLPATQDLRQRNRFTINSHDLYVESKKRKRMRCSRRLPSEAPKREISRTVMVPFELHRP